MRVEKFGIFKYVWILIWVILTFVDRQSILLENHFSVWWTSISVGWVYIEINRMRTDDKRWFISRGYFTMIGLKRYFERLRLCKRRKLLHLNRVIFRFFIWKIAILWTRFCILISKPNLIIMLGFLHRNDIFRSVFSKTATILGWKFWILDNSWNHFIALCFAPWWNLFSLFLLKFLSFFDGWKKLSYLRRILS